MKLSIKNLIFVFYFLFAFTLSMVADDLERGRELYQQGNYNEAVLVLESYARSIDGNSSKSKNCAEANYLLAKIYYEAGEDGKVGTYLKKALQIDRNIGKDETIKAFKALIEKYRESVPEIKPLSEELRSMSVAECESIFRRVKPALLEVSVEKEYQKFNSELGTNNKGEIFPYRTQFGGGSAKTWIGSGFYISADGYFLTSSRLIANAIHITVKDVDRTIDEAEIIGADPMTDVALLKISTKNAPYIAIEDLSDIGSKDNLFVGIEKSNPTFYTTWVKERGLNFESYGVSFCQTYAPFPESYLGAVSLDRSGKANGMVAGNFKTSSDFHGLVIPFAGIEIKKIISELRKKADKPKGGDIDDSVRKVSLLTVNLRSSYLNLTENEVKSILSNKKYFARVYLLNNEYSAPFGKGIDHQYEITTINGDQVVIDGITRLMWHQSGSDKWLTLSNARKWLDDMNRNGYAGYSDWRLPTLEEGASLLASQKMKSKLSIDPVFSYLQDWIWTGDSFSTSTMWVVHFDSSSVEPSSFLYSKSFVRPVRSMK